MHKKLPLQERKKKHTNVTALKLIDIMLLKESNVCISADLTTSHAILQLANDVGPYICAFKTHCDIIEDFSLEFVKKLESLAQKHQFLLFEDRKFADIGNTVRMQYGQGPFKIASWADLTNAHPHPGEGMVRALKEVGQPLGRGLLMISELSTSQDMVNSAELAMTLAEQHPDFVIGFIAQKRPSMSPSMQQDYLIWTPGVHLEVAGDTLGQHYRTPTQAILEEQCDILIVGRGIYQHANPIEQTKKYQKVGWHVYLQSIS
ncbi:orotidine 5'-phosphate decarboxylase [Coelomomyces lativittatus]|nr:orotidine 5'-phosphate decarboxylase [Coelomomyces lativittatus]KAJ1503573.1 orotidine 5'-phosphate decarboxylase [Coelomomyces lativittatus]KAJ1509668.1 orotidine 5'-phosphate decarboxylase [Coelomomyces lativittatus]